MLYGIVTTLVILHRPDIPPEIMVNFPIFQLNNITDHEVNHSLIDRCSVLTILYCVYLYYI